MNKNIRYLCKELYDNENGQAVIEYALILVATVICVIAISYTVLAVKNQFVFNACKINCSIIESQYKAYLNDKRAMHSEALYIQFIQDYGNDICPENYHVIYSNEKIQCSGHNYNKSKEYYNELQDSVPFL